MIMAPTGRPQRGALDKAARAAGISFNVVGEADSWPEMLHFVALGLGICVANGCVEPEMGTVSRRIEDLAPVTYSGVFRSADRGDPDLDRLLDALRGAAP
jgi:DNA-binding transcriptional LysR family regulator